MKSLLAKISLTFTIVAASLSLSSNQSLAGLITTITDILQINVTGKWPGLRFIGLTSKNTLVNIAPSGYAQVISVKGIDGNLQGIDFRPANGLLYGVTDTDNLYTINYTTGQATFVSKLSSSFDGGFQSGFDFNPVPDRLRIVGSNDQNFRTNVDTGAVTVDQPLAYASDDINAGVNPNISSAAYINSVAGATTTQLYNIDYDLDVLVLQNPPNNGVLRTIGKLGVNFAPTSGFDIFTDAQGNNSAYALSGSVLYSINLSTGAATAIANVPEGTFIGLAVTSQ
ncbi:DUF4394 domain-containing protein [Anabaena azotica]|uniref:DUF4394 domain-containing protein n=1 Tax=Anabaena azotica FACHB-119 TaxID=947527 RepID=A0ABR8CWU9_9NOST|nr:DUF4394 domain-containing protein [Anabaena azotica]MBD2499395.1 DUF4394 domain-containing protein [Anabaena azotica FACHB-119]